MVPVRADAAKRNMVSYGAWPRTRCEDDADGGDPQCPPRASPDDVEPPCEQAVRDEPLELRQQ